MLPSLSKSPQRSAPNSASQQHTPQRPGTTNTANTPLLAQAAATPTVATMAPEKRFLYAVLENLVAEKAKRDCFWHLMTSNPNLYHDQAEKLVDLLTNVLDGILSKRVDVVAIAYKRVVEGKNGLNKLLSVMFGENGVFYTTTERDLDSLCHPVKHLAHTIIIEKITGQPIRTQDPEGHSKKGVDTTNALQKTIVDLERLKKFITKTNTTLAKQLIPELLALVDEFCWYMNQHIECLDLARLCTTHMQNLKSNSEPSVITPRLHDWHREEIRRLTPTKITPRTRDLNTRHSSERAKHQRLDPLAQASAQASAQGSALSTGITPRFKAMRAAGALVHDATLVPNPASAATTTANAASNPPVARNLFI